MEFFELVKKRRSIRKYTDRQVEREKLDKIIEAGLYAPNAGGGQRAIICVLYDRSLCEKIGKLNLMRFNRKNLAGSYVSKEQPSNIDDPSIKNGFYGAPCVCVIFGQKNFLYSIPDAFCCAENMALAATELGVSSCIVARGEETFESDAGKEYLKKWNVPENYAAVCFVALGYCNGKYPDIKPRKNGRVKIIDNI